jgi:hypothetical protein
MNPKALVMAWSLTACDLVRLVCGVFGGQHGTKTDFLIVFRFYLITISPPMFLIPSYIYQQRHIIIAIDCVVK